MHCVCWHLSLRTSINWWSYSSSSVRWGPVTAWLVHPCPCQRSCLIPELCMSYSLGAGFWTQDISNAIVVVILPTANKVHSCSVYPRGNKRSHSGSRAGRHLWKYQRGCSLAWCVVVFLIIDFYCFSFPFQVVQKMMWLMDHVFKYTNFGLVSLIHGDFFIRQVRNTAGSGIVIASYVNYSYFCNFLLPHARIHHEICFFSGIFISSNCL